MKLPFTGERFIPEEKGNIFLEHYHRYLFAQQFVKNKVVVDIASGEGFGSYILSTEAQKVIGIDISSEAVSHAKEKYKKENLEFLIGECGNSGIPSNSVDVIVSFETLEHHDKHLETMYDFKRILKKDGILIISTPDKKTYTDARDFHNPYHVKELYEAEFKDLMAQFFKYTKFFQQKILFGSFLMEENKGHYENNYLYKDGEIKEINGILDPLYLIAVAADNDLSVLNSSILEQEINDSELIADWHKAMAIKDKKIDKLESELTRSHQNIDIIVNKLDDINNKYAAQIEAVNNKLFSIESSIIHGTERFDFLKNIIDERKNEYGLLISLLTEQKNVFSKSGRFIERKIRKVRKKIFSKLASIVGKSRVETSQNINQAVLCEALEAVNHPQDIEWAMPSVIKDVFILTPQHTLFLANTMKRHLETYGINVKVGHKYNKNDNYHLNFVLCAQSFDDMPPLCNTVIFQLEQSVSSRWFEEKYFLKLKKHHYILDYSISNIEFLVDNNIARDKIYYLPIGGYNNKILPNNEIKYDFLFYGDSLSCERRRIFLAELSRIYRVKVCNDLFGEDLYTLMAQSHCIINIHYYENALLETPRIFETLSMGKPILSEGASDQDQYPEITGSVLFFKENCIQDMLEKACILLENIDHYAIAIDKTIEQSEKRFSFMFNRFLASVGIIDKKYLLEEPIYLDKSLPVVALSLPETVKRRYSCTEDNNLPDFAIFDGIRFKPGWQACGYSYKVLAQHFLQTNEDMVTIFEDDAYLIKDELKGYETVKRYLEQRKSSWDLYAGMIADIHSDAKVIELEEWNGIKFVTLDRMTSMVFNIYNRSGLRYLADWPEINDDVNTNTIDRFLENTQNIRVVTSVPFIAGHKEDLSSTLWEFQNGNYTNMIKETEYKLSILINKYLRSGGHNT